MRKIKLINKNDYTELILDCGTIYKIDNEDISIIQNFKWFRGYYNYLCTSDCGLKRFHRLVMNAKESQIIDHINRDVTDNRKINLRIVDSKQNARNTCQRTGKYKGVSYTKKTGRWRATCSFGGKQKHLGYYDSAKEAAIAYDNYVLEECGGDCYMNFNSVLKAK